MEFTVNTSIPIIFEKIEDLPDLRFTKVKIYLCHTKKNLNNSYFDKKVIENAISSLANIPILGFIEVDNLNQNDFKGHEQKLVIDNNGVQIIYMGRAFGVIPSENNARFEMKTENGIEREYLVVEGVLWNKFQEAIDIFERDGSKPQSMELQPSSIEGSFKDDGLFHFSKFLFDGACILGSSVSPAMVGSVVEKVDFSAHNSFAEMLQEFNTYFSQYKNLQLNDVDVAVDFNKEGGDNVDEKLELFTKFSTLNEEDVAELKANIENYSIEELETKLNEIIEFKKNDEVEKPEDDAPSTFSLTAQQMEQEVRKALTNEKFADRWGDSVRSYYYIDHDDTRVYAEDVQNSYTPVGLNYSISGDFVAIDFSTKKRIKFVPQDMEEGIEITPTFVSLERSTFDSEKVQTDFTKQLDESNTKFDQLQTEFTSIKETNENLQAQITTYSETDLIQLKQELETLKSFKLEKEKEEKLAVLDKFSQLGEEETQPFKDQLDKFSVEELELQLFALIGKKGLQFSANTQKETNLVFALNNDIKSTDSNVPAWAEFVEQYKSKQK